MISIIIPAFNEEDTIGKLVKYLKNQATSSLKSVEIIIVDGGSADQTAAIAKREGAKVYKSPKKGRAFQMNYGASKAEGEWFYFLHADTKPPVGFLLEIDKKTEAGFKCGCFRLEFDYSHPLLKYYAWFTRFDVDVFRFGDQSLFVEKALFYKIGGFDEKLLVMEDQEIVTRLKNHAQFGIIKKSVTTSARKYQQFGVFRLQCIFSIIVVLFYLEISQEVIAHFYKTYMSGSAY
ncbi:MAG: hypothetical protein CL670_07580 [Balneola sp.]|jgi:rSAM/selenodomain-associated transferase 2|nr:hypothetical protein [Balneola sp.]MBE78997.1 hypothetical protein [Balneola sp.]|tara:strand:- start:115 stop:816 length:702 start_codon:yes stop_codon:yes gene_type:complete